MTSRVYDTPDGGQVWVHAAHKMPLRCPCGNQGLAEVMHAEDEDRATQYLYLPGGWTFSAVDTGGCDSDRNPILRYHPRCPRCTRALL